MRAFINAPVDRAKSSSRGTRPRASTSWRARGATRTSAPATRCSSRRWSTTRTSCRGSCCASDRGARCAWRRSTIAASCIMDEFDAAARRRSTKIVAAVHLSNALGTINPVAEIVRAGARGAARRCSIDGSQAAYHMPIDVQALGADFYVFTGHKVLRPDGHRRAVRPRSDARGDAAVPGRRRHDSHGDVREAARGTSCRTSSRPARRTSRARSALGAAIDYVRGIGFDAIARARGALLAHATAALESVPGVRIVGTRATEGERRVVRDGRHPSARHRHDRRSRRRRDPHRAITARSR